MPLLVQVPIYLPNLVWKHCSAEKLQSRHHTLRYIHESSVHHKHQSASTMLPLILTSSNNLIVWTESWSFQEGEKKRHWISKAIHDSVEPCVQPASGTSNRFIRRFPPAIITFIHFCTYGVPSHILHMAASSDSVQTTATGGVPSSRDLANQVYTDCQGHRTPEVLVTEHRYG